MIDTQIDHVAVVVRDIRPAMLMFCGTLGATFLFGGDVPAQANGVLQIAQSAWTTRAWPATISPTIPAPTTSTWG